MTYSLPSRIVQPTVDPRILEGEDAPEILEEINRAINTDYKENPKLKVLKLETINDKPTIIGSNNLVLPIVSRVVSPDYRLILPEELEKSLQEGDPLGIEGKHYVDYGLALDFSGRNHDLATQLFNQLPRDLQDLDRLPGVVLNYGLENSDLGSYGVAPTFVENTSELRTAKILAQDSGNFYPEDAQLIESGLPSRLGTGSRYLYTASQGEPSQENLGFSGLCLNGSLSLGSEGVDLAGSLGSGRVVLMPKAC